MVRGAPLRVRLKGVSVTTVKSSHVELTAAQRKQLRTLGHDLHPLVLVGQKGLTDGLVASLDEQLLAHELVKVKVHDSDAVDEAATVLAERTGAALVQSIGKVLLFYRAHPDEPKIRLVK